MANKNMELEKGQVLLYQTDEGSLRLECRLEGESLWLSLNQIAELFDRDKSVISKHLKSIYDDAELPREATGAKHATVQSEGDREVNRQIEYYNLEAIFAVGYRVRSSRGIQFRQWATAQLKEFLTKGFIMDDERLKNPDSSVYKSFPRSRVGMPARTLLRPVQRDNLKKSLTISTRDAGVSTTSLPRGSVGTIERYNIHHKKEFSFG